MCRSSVAAILSSSSFAHLLIWLFLSRPCASQSDELSPRQRLSISKEAASGTGVPQSSRPYYPCSALTQGTRGASAAHIRRDPTWADRVHKNPGAAQFTAQRS